MKKISRWRGWVGIGAKPLDSGGAGRFQWGMRWPYFWMVVGMLVGAVVPGRADLTAGLGADQVQQIKSGQMVVTQKDIPGGVWPQLTVYTVVNAPVATVGGVFRDYDHASDFQPSVISAKVVNQPAPNVFDVEYTQKMPIFGTTSFTVQNTFKDSAGGLDVTWKLLKSSMAEVSDGSLRVEPYGAGSVMRYTNYVKPKLGALAGMARGAAVGEVKATVAALKAEAEKRAAR